MDIIIVVTAPTASIATEYARELQVLKSQQSSQLPELHCIEFFCVSDPDSRRVGSGGGTLNAMDTLLSVHRMETLLTKRVIIIHSGGDSRRAPTHSVCGKAWASVTSTLTPLVLLIKEMIDCCTVPASSTAIMPFLLIASGDVLLDINRGPIPLIDNSVCVVGVPEKVTTSCNHGVIIPTSLTEGNCNISTTRGGASTCSYIASTMDYYLQKPKISEIYDKNGAYSFEIRSINSSELKTQGSYDMDSLKNAPAFSIIDTGIVIYTGSAYAAILSIVTDPIISTCTLQLASSKSSTLSSPLQEEHDVVPPPSSIDPALRLELYTELLIAPSTNLHKKTFFDYLGALNVRLEDHMMGVWEKKEIDEIKTDEEKHIKTLDLLLMNHGTKYIRALHTLHKRFSTFIITTILVIDGHFAHLGTSEEVLSLCCKIHDRDGDDASLLSTYPSSSSMKVVLKSDTEKIDVFARKYALNNKTDTSYLKKYASSSRGGITNINSVLDFNGSTCSSDSSSSSAGRATSVNSYQVVEHSILTGSISVGNQCIISHFFPHALRDFSAPIAESSQAESCLVIPGNLMLQHIFLMDKNINDDPFSNNANISFESSICRYTSTIMLLGMKDDIKKACILVNAKAECDASRYELNNSATFLNRKFSKFLEFAGATVEDIWPQLKSGGASMDLSLWSAKLFPYLENAAYVGSQDASGSLKNINNRGLWDWMIYFASTQYEVAGGADILIQQEQQCKAKKWLLSTRLSLSEIILKSNLSAMFGFRNFIRVLSAPSNIYFQDLILRAERQPKPLPKLNNANANLSLKGDSSIRVGTCLDTAACVAVYVTNTVRLVSGAIAKCIAKSKTNVEGAIQVAWDVRDVAASSLSLLWYLEMLIGDLSNPQLEEFLMEILESNLPLEFIKNNEPSSKESIGGKSAFTNLLSLFRALYSMINVNFLEELKLVSLELLMSMIASQSRRACLKAVLVSLLQSTPRVAPERHPKLLLLGGVISNCMSNLRDGECNLSSKAEAAISILKSQMSEALSDVFASNIESNRGNHKAVLSSMGQVITSKMIPFVRDNISVNENHGDSSSNDNYKSLFETWAQKLVSTHIQYSLNSRARLSSLTDLTNGNGINITSSPITSAASVCSTVVCQSSVRVDIAGGWSDTPPIAYDMGGSVLNAAIKVDGQHPLMVVGRVTKKSGNGGDDGGGGGCIILRSLRLRSESDYAKKRDSSSSSNTSINSSNNVSSKLDGDESLCTRMSDFNDLLPHTPNALLRAAAVVTGLDGIVLQSKGLQVEVASLSYLPQGSGTGASSCLAGAAVRAMECIADIIKGGGENNNNSSSSSSSSGNNSSTSSSLDTLVDRVSAVEQLMTTGGGWQDQVGSIFGGFKIGRSAPVLPMTVSVSTLSQLPEAFVKAFERRAFLVYTGQSRLAKNTLINALYRYSMTPSTSSHSLDSIIIDLVAGANFGYDTLRSHCSNNDEDPDIIVDRIAATISNYWSLKARMAHGSETPMLMSLLHSYLPQVAEGAGMLGAGAGGFAIVITKRRGDTTSSSSSSSSTENDLYFSKDDIEGVVRRFESDFKAGGGIPALDSPLSVHSLSIDTQANKLAQHLASGVLVNGEPIILDFYAMMRGQTTAEEGCKIGTEFDFKDKATGEKTYLDFNAMLRGSAGQEPSAHARRIRATNARLDSAINNDRQIHLRYIPPIQ